jgi:hypothetical protein
MGGAGNTCGRRKNAKYGFKTIFGVFPERVCRDWAIRLGLIWGGLQMPAYTIPNDIIEAWVF